MFEVAVGIVSIFSGIVASIAGFGIGSLLTPLFTTKIDISVAVAGVSIAHFFGTLLRFIFWRKHTNKQVLLSFGVTSAIGGLTGAILHSVLYSSILSIIFSCLLIFAGFTGLTGLSEKIRFRGIWAWVAGGLSGIFGGLVGNQGGIRSASMLGFNLSQKEYVATATGIALMVDCARLPIYLVTQKQQLLSIKSFIIIATFGVLVGTSSGTWFLKKIPERQFKTVLSTIILLIGIFILLHK